MCAASDEALATLSMALGSQSSDFDLYSDSFLDPLSVEALALGVDSTLDEKIVAAMEPRCSKCSATVVYLEPLSNLRHENVNRIERWIEAMRGQS